MSHSPYYEKLGRYRGRESNKENELCVSECMSVSHAVKIYVFYILIWKLYEDDLVSVLN